MALFCTPDQLCADGNGLCNPNGTFCECFDQDYVDVGDFRRSTGCRVNVLAFQILWSFTAVVFSVDILLGMLAIYFMKRKRETSRRFDIFNTCLFMTVAGLALWLCCLQLTSSTVTQLGTEYHVTRRIGIDVSSSLVFGGFNILSYTGALMKPMVKSETSIARFAFERMKRLIALSYKPTVVFLFVCLVLASACPVIAALHPDIEWPITQTYAVSLLDF